MAGTFPCSIAGMKKLAERRLEGAKNSKSLLLGMWVWCVITFKVIFRTNAMNVHFCCLPNYIKILWCYCQLAISGHHDFIWSLRFCVFVASNIVCSGFAMTMTYTPNTRTNTRTRSYTFATKCVCVCFFLLFCFYKTRKYRFTEISCQKHFEAILVWPDSQKLWMPTPFSLSKNSWWWWWLLLWRGAFTSLRVQCCRSFHWISLQSGPPNRYPVVFVVLLFLSVGS